MRQTAILILLSASCSLAMAATTSIFVPPNIAAQDRVFFDALDPTDIFAKWGPFGYFNQYLDPSNAVGPEILKGFGSPFMPYNGYNIMQSITTPPLQIPPEATSTAGYDPDLFAPPSSDSFKEAATTTAPVPVSTKAPKPKNPNPNPGAYNGHSGGFGNPNFRPQVIRGAYKGPGSQFVGYHPANPNSYPTGIDMTYRRRYGNHNGGYGY